MGTSTFAYQSDTESYFENDLFFFKQSCNDSNTLHVMYLYYLENVKRYDTMRMTEKELITNCLQKCEGRPIISSFFYYVIAV